jgi:pyruvate/2-oxoacid:ferredoxin oxidoreductase alpha subunit
MNTRVADALADSPLSSRDKQQCKNFYTLGMMYWVYSRPLEATLDWVAKKFASKPDVAQANQLALKAGYNAGDIHELFQGRYEVPKATLSPGTYRNIMGNQALAIGIVAGAELTGTKVVFSSYPITPASSVLETLATYKHFGVVTIQAEDEIAAICNAIGASFAGKLGITSTSGPGMALKTEAMGLAVMTELPLVILDIQRAGPSTGMPTKVEQSDLLQSVFGRNGDTPMPVLAISRPSDAFEMAIEACRIAVRYMTPVILLSDNFIANGAEPWRLPDLDKLERFPVEFKADGEAMLQQWNEQLRLAELTAELSGEAANEALYLGRVSTQLAIQELELSKQVLETTKAKNSVERQRNETAIASADASIRVLELEQKIAEQRQAQAEAQAWRDEWVASVHSEAQGLAQVVELEDYRLEQRAQQLESENQVLHQQLDDRFGLEQIVGQSPAMAEVFEVMQDRGEPILVLGIFIELPGLHAFGVLAAMHNVAVECFQPHGNFMVVHRFSISGGGIDE